MEVAAYLLPVHPLHFHPVLLWAVSALLWPTVIPGIVVAAPVGPQVGARVLGLRPGVVFGMMAVANFTCCVPMAMPQQHLIAFCGDLGISRATGALMLSVLLGAAFASRQVWGVISDRIGGLKTILISSGAQAVALLEEETGAAPVLVPELEGDVHDLDGLHEVGELLLGDARPPRRGRTRARSAAVAGRLR